MYVTTAVGGDELKLTLAKRSLAACVYFDLRAGSKRLRDHNRKQVKSDSHYSNNPNFLRLSKVFVNDTSKRQQ